MNKRNGFTLLELLAVIVVLALLIILAIPAIVNVVSDSKKNSFYIYTSKVYQQALNRYLADYNSATNGELKCTSYRIPQDLKITDSGSYVGWVKMERVADDSGNVELTKNLSDSRGLYSVRYCTKYNADCNPSANDQDSTFSSNYWEVPEDANGNTGTSTTIRVTSKPGYHMCVQYQYPVGNNMVSSSVDCSYQSNALLGDSFKYKMTLSMKDGNNAVENFVLYQDSNDNNIQNEDNKKKLFDAMETYKRLHRNNPNEMRIDELTCNGQQGGYISDPGNTSTTIATSTNPTEESTTVYNTDETTTDINYTQRPTQQPSTKVNSVLLTDLTVVGYDIRFNPGHITYEVQVPYATQALSISWIKANDDVEVEMSGAENIVVGSNQIIVHAYNPKTNEEIFYYITVIRLPNPETPKPTQHRVTVTAAPQEGLPDPSLASSNAKLNNILVGGYELSDVFSPDIFAYDVEVDAGTTELAINPVLQEVSASYQIFGEKDIKDGGVITIEVLSQNKYYHNTYTLTVHYRKTAQTGTVILRAIAVVLAVVLLILVIVIRKQKKSQQVIDDSPMGIEKGGYVDPTKIDE
ncbi:MAG: prepilin-type N-terminal cleavage/methylation domain-containing protein [Bacilli bacterium]|nr:prepilin-type N-terminal cleavage/methylation domain-containing protein [Bacilli bacterium]